MKNMHARRANGFGLVETLLTLGALSALSLGIYLVLSPTSAAAKAKVEQDNLRDLSTAVDRSFGLLGSFQGVSALRVVEDGLAPTRMVDGSTLRTAWSTSVTVAPHTVNAPGDGFVVVYPFAPADVCPRLAAAVARDVFDIRVEGVSVFDAGQLNPSAAAAACGQADTATMEFVYHSGLVAGAAVAAPPLQLPPAPTPVSTPTSPPVGGPVGPAGSVGPAGPLGPVTSAPPVTPPPPPPSVPPPSTPVTPTTPPPAPPPSAPPPPTTVTACVAPSSWTQTDSRSSPCPVGQIGLVFEGRTAQHSYTCPEAWAAPAETVSPWSAWTVTSTTCAPACTAPAPSTTAITRAAADENANVGCPVGQLGDHWQRRSVTEHGTRTTSWTCPGPTSATSDTWGGGFTYGAWVTTSNTCAGACVLPTPSTQTNTENRTAQQSLACPAGQTGEIKQERQEQRTQTRIAYCPAPTGAYSWGGWSTWSAWTPITAWATVSNTCAPTMAPIQSSCRLKGPGSVEKELRNGCEVIVRLKGESGKVSAKFMLDADPAQYSISWSGDCSGSGASCTNSAENVDWSRPGRSYEVSWTATHLSTGTVQSGQISAYYGEK